MRCNPHYPGWYASALSTILYLGKDYEGAVASLNKVGTLAIRNHRWLAASYAQLGRQDEAQRHIDAVLESNPDFSLQAFMATLKFRRDADNTTFSTASEMRDCRNRIIIGTVYLIKYTVPMINFTR